MIIDAHVYCLPDRLRDPNVRLPLQEALISNALYRHPQGAYALGLACPEMIVASMRRSAIDRSALVSLPWRSPALCRENNDFILEASRLNRDFLAVCSVQPRAKAWKLEAQRCLAAGAAGIKINPVWQGYSLDDPAVHDLADFVRDRRAFLMVHVDHAFKISDSSAGHLCKLAAAHPDTRILAAHLGGMAGIYALYPPVAEILANVWFDTAVSATIRMVKLNIDAGLAGKIVFGSDFPFNHSHRQSQVLRSIRALKLGAAAEKRIFALNFLSLIRG
ncbi:MAG TPA: amidohydrolase family protein [Candidatus Omnitrophota bacterium]|nr:amidohydrolase family protein [Candidatus Omnitrophota bacterium]HNQ50906.1 amidohydrolase family protein [Candidatus Omnitrophota bacterium]